MTNDQPRDPAATSEVARLLPCPFCGDSNPKIYMNAPSSDRTPWPHVVCISCGCGMTSIEAWNRRAAPTAVQAAGDAVAWCHRLPSGELRSPSMSERSAEWFAANGEGVTVVPLYLAAPTVADRVPLTEGFIRGLWDKHVGEPSARYPLGIDDFVNFTRAVEYQHGIHAEKSPATDPLVGEA